jgi:flagellar assembly factor FliW
MSASKTFYFPQGILGFENIKEFLLVPAEENCIFFWLQAKNETNISFLIVDPFLFFPDYELHLNTSVKDILRVTQKEEVAVYTIVNIPGNDFQQATTNLLGPLIFNNKNGRALQLVLEGTAYRTKHLLFSPQKVLQVSVCG